MQFFATENRREIKLPKFSSEAKCRPVLVKVCDPLQADRLPEVCERDIGANWSEFQRGVKRKGRTLGDEAAKRITVEVIAMR